VHAAMFPSFVGGGGRMKAPSQKSKQINSFLILIISKHTYHVIK
jgi:hypothetical protein